jgi:hypothetical protein
MKMAQVIRNVLKALVVAIFAVGVAGNAAAEKVKIHFTKNARQMHAEAKLNPKAGDARELSRYLYVDQIDKSEGIAFFEERGIDTDDQVEGSGSHSGIASDVAKNGEEIYQTFAGTHKTTTTADAKWEVNYEGDSILHGGTGKYKNARGKLHYKGRITPDSFFEEDVGEVEY